MQVEYEARSESYRVWCRSQDEYNFMKLISSPAFNPYKFLKNCQNSIYGKLVSEMGIYTDTDSIHLTDKEMKYMKRDELAVKALCEKENNKMIKGLDYILVHVDKEPVIIFTKQIVSISKDEGRAFIQCTKAAGYLTDESYADIVKQVL